MVPFLKCPVARTAELPVVSETEHLNLHLPPPRMHITRKLLSKWSSSWGPTQVLHCGRLTGGALSHFVRRLFPFISFHVDMVPVMPHDMACTLTLLVPYIHCIFSIFIQSTIQSREIMKTKFY